MQYYEDEQNSAEGMGSLTKAFRTVVLLVLVLAVGLSALQWAAGRGQAQRLQYSQFVDLVDKGQVEMVRISGDQTVAGRLVDGTQFTVVIPPNDTELIRDMREQGVQISYDPPGQGAFWPRMLMALLPALLIIGVFFFIMRRSQGGAGRAMQFGKSRARLHQPGDGKEKVTFADVAGIDEVREELQEIVDFLQRPQQYLSLGARIPRGVLMLGRPGTGKTLAARAVAGEAGVPFFTISGSDFVEMFVGVGASRVRDLFGQARKSAPCVVFIDEIDAVGRQRGAGLGGGHDEREQTLNQLLVEMDGFEAGEGIIVIAATNRPDVLDPALLRPGRFDRHIVLDPPDVKGRRAIFAIHTRKKPLDETVDLDVLARRTPGFTGADIANATNEAALLAARRRKDKISMQEMEDALDRIMAGGPEKKTRVMIEEERKRVAWHEAGHALLGKLLPHCKPVHKISIIPRGRALGYVLSLPHEDKYLTTRSELFDEMAMALGGRAAEELIFGDLSSGAGDDINKVTEMARKMVMQFGMSEQMGPLAYGADQGSIFLGRDMGRTRDYSEQVASRIDAEVKDLVTRAYDRAMTTLKEHRAALQRVAEALLQRETLNADDLEQLVVQS